jgi:hypothetical protein
MGTAPLLEKAVSFVDTVSTVANGVSPGSQFTVWTLLLSAEPAYAKGKRVE